MKGLGFIRVSVANPRPYRYPNPAGDFCAYLHVRGTGTPKPLEVHAIPHGSRRRTLQRGSGVSGIHLTGSSRGTLVRPPARHPKHPRRLKTKVFRHAVPSSREPTRRERWRRAAPGTERREPPTVVPTSQWYGLWQISLATSGMPFTSRMEGSESATSCLVVRRAEAIPR